MAADQPDQTLPKRGIQALSLLEISEVVRNIGIGLGAVFAAVGAVSAYLLDNFVKSYHGTGEARLFLTLAIFLLSLAVAAGVTGYVFMVGRMLKDMVSEDASGARRIVYSLLRVAIGIVLGLLWALYIMGMITAFWALAETVADIWRQV